MELLSLCSLISRMIPLVLVFHQSVNAKHCFCHNIAYIVGIAKLWHVQNWTCLLVPAGDIGISCLSVKPYYIVRKRAYYLN